MIVDEAVIDRLLYLQKAYPSKAADTDYLSKNLSFYFSKGEIEDRVKILSTSMVSKKPSGLILYKHYPLLLFFSKKYKKGRKLIVDRRKSSSEMRRFKEFFIDFGIPFHLKKHGNSEQKLFKLIPEFKVLGLSEVRSGKKDPFCGWKVIWDFLEDYGYFSVSHGSSNTCRIENDCLNMSQLFWKRALNNLSKINNLDVYIESYRYTSSKNILLKIKEKSINEYI